MAAADTLLEQREIDLLRWRSRRGLVENDLYIERFFTTYGHQLTQRHADAWTALMNLGGQRFDGFVLAAHRAQGRSGYPRSNRSAGDGAQALIPPYCPKKARHGFSGMTEITEKEVGDETR